MLVFKSKNNTSHIFSKEKITHIKMGVSPFSSKVIQFEIFTPSDKFAFSYEYADDKTAAAKYEDFILNIQSIDHCNHAIVIEE